MVDYDLTREADITNLAKAKAKLEDPRADDTWDHGAGTAILTAEERAVFEEAVLNSPEAIHEASLLISYLREVKGSALHTGDNGTN